MEKKKSTFRTFMQFLPYYKPYIGTVCIDLLCAALTTLCELVFPMLVRYITNTAQYNPEALLLSSVLKLGGLYLFLRLVDTAANYYMAYVGHVMGTKLETDMRRDLFAHLQTLSYNFFDNTKVGQLMTRVTTDLFDITEFSHHFPEEMFIAAIKMIGAFIILGGINLTLTLLLFLVLPVMLISVALFRKNMKEAFKEQRVQVGELNADIEDSLLGIRVVKSFANEDVEQKKFDLGNQKFYKAKKKAYVYMARFQGANRFFDGVMYVAGIVLGSIFMIRGHINPADLIAYILYIQTLIASIRKIVEFTEQFQRGITGIERFTEIMNEVPDIKDCENPIALSDVRGEIEFQNVCFKYNDSTENVLENINLHAKPGENIALVGPSGGGKTTLCNLIGHFYEIQSGQILLDGTDIREISLKSLRDHIGVVAQDVYMFCGTVKDNICYGKMDATDDEIIEAAKLAGAHEFIMGLTDGYDTYIGERGIKLSGGQKQRLAIARVFLKNPPILILDEATSALDNESELIVQQSLEKLAKGRTTFTVAHRLTTIRNADKIVVLTDEGIVEEGSHTELMDKGGLYSNLYSMYTKIK